MISVQDLEMSFGSRILFQKVQLQLVSGQRYGLVGANGSGKSTFLKILSGEEDPVFGKVQSPGKDQLGVLQQDHFQYDEILILDTVLMGKPKIYRAMKEMSELLDREDFSVEVSDRYSKLEASIAEMGGYAAESEAAKLLEGLGIQESKHLQLMKTLSGGYKLRVLLAQVLFSEPSILLLDEPTNHLDLYSIRWLENYLKRFNGTIVVISHDREFINRISTHILDVDFGTINMYKGNYDQYLKRVEEVRFHHESVIAKAEKKKDELQNFVDRFRAKASKARQAQSKARMIDKLQDEMDEHVLQQSSRRSPRLNFIQESRTGVTPLKITNLFKSYGEHQVLNDISIEMNRGEKVAIVGPNGVGKSTLLKICVEDAKADKGKVEWGYQARHAYLPQDVEKEVDAEVSLLKWLDQAFPLISEGEIRKALANVLFMGDDVQRSVRALSGGEKARLLLSKMMLEKPNVLIFDEPTNHLDIEAIETLCDAILKFEGTVLFVSHNRWFVSKLATRVIEITPEKVVDYEGGYEDMLKKMGQDHLERDVSLKERYQKEGEVLDPKALKEREKELQAQVSKYEKKVNTLERDLENLADTMAEPEFYTSKSEDEKKLIYKQQKEKEDELESLMKAWEDKGRELEKLRKSFTDS